MNSVVDSHKFFNPSEEKPKRIRSGSKRRRAMRALAVATTPSRHDVFQRPYVRYCEAAAYSPETRSQADELFTQLGLGGYKLDAKRDQFASLVHFGKVAMWERCPIAYSRRARNTLPVIDAAVAAGLFRLERAPPGSPCMSRLLAAAPLHGLGSIDPANIEPPSPGGLPLIRMRCRASKEEIAFDPNHPVAVKYAECLSLINTVNADYKITFQPFDDIEGQHVGKRIIRAEHFARFTDDFDHHGRIYTGRYGHQSLRKIERETIRFDGNPSVELDFGGFHPRMLYHGEGIDYQADPYALWEPTSPAQRQMAKVLLNTAINAKNRTAALSAANLELCPRTKGGEWKKGNEAERAAKLRTAAEQCGLTFKTIYPTMLGHHEPIADHFASDAGLRLMNVDGAIALDVMFAFAQRGVPCLGVHDSFVVPADHEGLLRAEMLAAYRARFPFDPVIKSA